MAQAYLQMRSSHSKQGAILNALATASHRSLHATNLRVAAAGDPQPSHGSLLPAVRPILWLQTFGPAHRQRFTKMSDYAVRVDSSGDVWRFSECAFCGQRAAKWVHDLDRTKTDFRKFGKSHTLPDWWGLCQLCEDAYRSGDEDRSVARMMLRDSEWNIYRHMAERAGINFDLEENVRKPLRAFRAADLGRRPAE